MEYPSKTECPTGIYKIFNKIDQRTYVGQTSIDLVGRWKSHVSALENQTHRNPFLQRAWNKYGPAAFTATVELYVPRTDDINTWLEKLDTEERRILLLCPDHYNLMEAGEDGWVFSEESRARASYSAKHRNITKEEHELWEQRRLAAVRSVESCLKRSIAHEKMWQDPFYRAHLVEKYNSPEVVAKKSKKISESFTPERSAQYTQMNNERWADPTFREKTIKSITAARNNPISAELYSKGISRGWVKRKADPDYEKKNQERIAKIRATKAAKKALRLAAQEQPAEK